MEHTETIKKNYEFRRLYAKGKSAVTPTLVVYTRRVKTDGNRVGFTVTTRLGHAVTRNRVRRRLRGDLPVSTKPSCAAARSSLLSRARAASPLPTASWSGIFSRLPAALTDAGGCPVKAVLLWLIRFTGKISLRKPPAAGLSRHAPSTRWKPSRNAALPREAGSHSSASAGAIRSIPANTIFMTLCPERATLKDGSYLL